LCQIYEFRPFKCRIFGTTYHYPSQEEGAVGIACQKYGDILNDNNFDVILCDVTELLYENTDLSIIHDKKGNVASLNPEFPLIFHLYKHFIIDKLGSTVVDYDEKFKNPRNVYYNTIVR